MEKFEIIITTLFGLESLVAREVRRLGYETTSVEDGRVTFMGDNEAVCRANMWIRTGERVLIKTAEFTAVTFDELFEKTKAVDWSKWIGKNDAFPVKGYSLKSTLASVRDCQAIIKKATAESLSSKYFRSHMKHVLTVPDNLPENPQLFLNIELLGEAIYEGRKVSFQYLEYGVDKKLHPKLREDGSVREYVVNPYQMAAKEGKYYLICNYDKYDDISNYRVDRITKVEKLDEPAKPFESLPWAKERRLDLAKYMREHIYMFSSENVKAKFRIVKPMISDVIDMFGKEVRFSDETDDTVTVTATVNEMSMLQFARSFAPDVVLLEPEFLAKKVKETAERTVEAYKDI